MDDHIEEAKVVEEAAKLPVRINISIDLWPNYEWLLFYLQIKIAVYASLAANFSLCVLQRTCQPTPFSWWPLHLRLKLVYAAISALSLSILATGIDSVFDIGSNVVLYIAHRQASRLDINKWPVGGMRLETIGNIIYGNRYSNIHAAYHLQSYKRLAYDIC